jgi:hypothetical protein
MRMIIEDRDGLSGEFYASMQAEADQDSNGMLAIEPPGWGEFAHIAILAIETGDGTFGWLKGTVPGEQARALRLAAAVLTGEIVVSSTERARVIAYLADQAERLERSAAQLEART